MQELQKRCDDFNAKCPLGTKGWLRMYSGERRFTYTRSKAQVLGGSIVVIWLDGVSGSYLIDRFKPAY